MPVSLSHHRPAFLPTPGQELLLQACLFEREEALAAWQAWRSRVNFDTLDWESMRLLPLLADKLLCLGVRDPTFHIYRGVQRQAWARHQLLFRAAVPALRRLRALGIPAMALKGIVLAAAYYKSASLRPMSDFDLLVRPADASRTLDLLEELGWRLSPSQFRPRSRFEFAVRPAAALEDPRDPEIQVDLHWRLLWARFSPEAETALWRRALPFDVAGAGCLAPCAADLLAHVCAHGVKWNGVPSLRWVVDAAFLVRSGAVDWPHLCDQAERLGLALPLTETLNYLRTVMLVQVPGQVIERLAGYRVKSIDRLLHEAQLQPSTQWSLLTAIRIHRHIAWHELARRQGPIGYWRYFAALRRGRSGREVVSWIRQRLARRLTS